VKGFIIKNGFFKLGNAQETASARLERLIKTPINSMYGYLDEGSRVLEYFYLKSNGATCNSILTEIKMLVRAYETGLTLTSLGVTISTPEKSAADLLSISMEYNLGGNNIKTVVINSKATGDN
jgi:hypothetical protein